MKRLCIFTFFIVFSIYSVYGQTHPRLLFNETDYDNVKGRYTLGLSNVQPYANWVATIGNNAKLPSENISSTKERWEYDREMARRAKAWAVKYAMSENLTDGDNAYYWLFNHIMPYRDDADLVRNIFLKFKLENGGDGTDRFVVSMSYNRWMETGFALIDYCQAYDLLMRKNSVNKNYFEAKFGNDASAKKNLAVNYLTLRVGALFDMTANDFHGNVGDITKRSAIYYLATGGGLIIPRIFNLVETGTDFDPYVNKVTFRFQMGNMRIIVASAIGVAAITLAGEIDVNYDKSLFQYAKKVINHYLLEYNQYTDYSILGKTGKVAGQYCGGAFPEGPAYFNYSAEAFIPFMIANRNSQTLLGTEFEQDYFQDQHMKEYFDWCLKTEMPNHEMPWINASYARDQKSYGGMLAMVMTNPNYRWQFENNGNVVGNLFAEGLSVYNKSSTLSSTAPSYDPIYRLDNSGQIIFRSQSSPDANLTYMCLSTENGQARYGAETHGHGDAGSFSIYSKSLPQVVSAGYAGHKNSENLEKSSYHSTVNAIVGSVIQEDKTRRNLGLGPAANSTILNSKNVSNFSYAKIENDIIAEKNYDDLYDEIYAAWTEGASENQSLEQLQSFIMQNIKSGNKVGIDEREVLHVNCSANGGYFIIRDKITKTNTNMSSAACFYQGGSNDIILKPNNGGATWNLSGGLQLDISVSGLGGIANQSAVDRQYGISQGSGDGEFGNHKSLQIQPIFSGNTANVLAVIDPSGNPSLITNRVIYPQVVYTVDGRNRSYGNYDVIISQNESQRVNIPINDLPFPIKTDAKYLIVSFLDANFNNPAQTKIFSIGATYINLGDYTYLPTGTDEIQTTFTSFKSQTAAPSNAFTPTSQRKLFRSFYGNLHLTYEAQGRVWYERSTDNGVTWQFCFVSDKEAKLPSISSGVTNDGVFLVYQERNESESKLKIKTFTAGEFLGSGEVADLITTPYTDNTNPVVDVGGDGKIFVLWEQNSGNPEDFIPPGLWYQIGTFNSPSNVFSWSSGGIIAGTGTSSNTPSVSAYSDQSETRFAIVYQDVNTIKYCVVKGPTWGNEWTIINPIDISSGSGYTNPFLPSIIAAGTGARVTWGARRYVSIDEDQMAKSEAGGGGYWEYRSIFRDASATGPFWNFGYNVTSVNITRSLQSPAIGYPVNGYVVSWSQSSGVPNQYTTHATLSKITNLLDGSGNLQSGGYVQFNNGYSSVSADVFKDMRAMSFNVLGTPKQFQISKSVYELEHQSLQKSDLSNNGIIAGREGVVISDSAQFYFAFGDIIVDGKSIDFETIPDSIIIDTKEKINSYLVTKPFEITNTSKLLYGVQYGIIDSVAVAKTLTGSKNISFVVQLIDDATKTVIGEFNNVKFNKDNVLQSNNIGYEVNTDGIGKKTICLRLVVNPNFESKYGLVQKYNTEMVLGLGKNQIRRKQINYKMSVAVLNYALSQNYPNPFNPTTTINYALPKAGNVVLKVYDVLGKEVATLVNNYKESGRYSVEFDASKLSSGMYIYKLTSDKFSEVKKMMLVK